VGREASAYDELLVPPGDVGLAALATRQHGVISAAQLHAVELTPTAIHRRLRAGGLHRVHRGVYAVGHPRLPARGRLWAAVLVSGGVLSHRSAAAAWELLSTPSRVEVTTSS
jgi:predicted transcriptional regulator of viral defense system